MPAALTAQAVFAQIGGLSADTDYVFRLAATNELDSAPVQSETADFTTPPNPTVALVLPGLAPPTAGQTVNVEPVEGAVGTKCGNDAGFARLQGAEQIPVGCTVDTRNGTVALTASKGSSGETQTAYFWGGVFDVDQKAGDDQDAVLTLAGRLKCEKRKAGMTSRVSSERQARGRAQTLGQRQGQLQNGRQLRLGQRARHDVAGRGSMRQLDSRQGPRRHGLGAGLRQEDAPWSCTKASSTWRKHRSLACGR